MSHLENSQWEKRESPGSLYERASREREEWLNFSAQNPTSFRNRPSCFQADKAQKDNCKLSSLERTSFRADMTLPHRRNFRKAL